MTRRAVIEVHRLALLGEQGQIAECDTLLTRVQKLLAHGNALDGRNAQEFGAVRQRHGGPERPLVVANSGERDEGSVATDDMNWDIDL